MAKDGLSAYCDFWFPYPPLSLPLIYFPARFFSDFDGYRFAFRLEMMAFDAATVLLLFLFLRDRMKVSSWRTSIAVMFYCVLGFSGAHLIYDRLDIVVSMLILSAVYFYTGEGWRRWGYHVSLVAGTLVKILPFFFIPLFCILEWFRTDGDRWPSFRRAWKPILWAALPVAAALVGYNAFVCNHLFAQLSQHTVRGIQIESNWAVPLVVDRVLNGSTVQVDYTYGAFHLVDSCVAPWYLWLAKNLGLALLLGYFILLWRWFRRNLVQSEKLGAYAIALLVYGVVLFIITTQRVLSPQYFIWMWPLAAIELAVAKDWRAVLVGSALVFGMTYVVFDIGFMDLLQFDPRISAALVVRNGAATLWALDTLRRSSRALRESRRSALNAALS